ncbi:GNAT family acetyltransferase [Tersicoccus solisilvae]|uniref:GNAT family acetyltransferase n=1 Tax=Tersicoccus solisilvae TaxID=1882339 RepID=A0ABQ1NNJ6_9MICC|nr:GNAT family N-acetyltransferase [Tersicoccus solisilvae]GGC81625.1 GNAT family acetyltransferase [Tersicoccus solisilvae]
MDSISLPGTRFRIARAVEADVPAIVTLLTDDPLGSKREDAPLACYLSAFNEITADEHQLLLVVKDSDGHVVGTTQLTLIPGLARGGAKRLHIEAVRLAPSVRGDGVGTALFRAIGASSRRSERHVALVDSAR